MIADLNTYKEYKESGLPWLGKVPRHWEIRRLKSTTANVIEQTTDMKADEVYVALEHVESWTGRVRAQFGSALFSGQVKRFKSNDVLFGKLRPYLAKVARVGRNGVCAGEFFVLRPTNTLLSTAYLEHQLRAKYTIDIINSSTFGAKMPRADWQFCGNLLIPLPPPTEQTAIVRFLNWASGRLDRAIRAKRKVIALLNEQKDAIIQRTVTRGLDASVPLKDSGVPWLGDIPEHWELRRLSAVAHFRSGKAHEPFVTEAGAHICVTARFVSTNGSATKRCSRNLCRARQGDVLMVMSDLPGGRALARAFMVRDNRSYAVNQRVCAITAHAIDPRMLAYCANRNWHLLRNDDGLNQTHLSNYDFKTMPIVLPPAHEQQQIADYLDIVTSKAEKTIERLQRECELLLEYRSRLVDEVVTGKLDVRAVAATLPTEETLGDIADSHDSDELYNDTHHPAEMESDV